MDDLQQIKWGLSGKVIGSQPAACNLPVAAPGPCIYNSALSRSSWKWLLDNWMGYKTNSANLAYVFGLIQINRKLNRDPNMKPCLLWSNTMSMCWYTTILFRSTGQLAMEDVPTLVLCKPKLLPLKSVTLEKLEKMQMEAQEAIKQQELASRQTQ